MLLRRILGRGASFLLLAAMVYLATHSLGCVSRDRQGRMAHRLDHWHQEAEQSRLQAEAARRELAICRTTLAASLAEHDSKDRELAELNRRLTLLQARYDGMVALHGEPAFPPSPTANLDWSVLDE